MTKERKEELKKIFYKEKQVATRILNTGAEDDHYLYNTQVDGEDIWFKVPVSDMGDAKFQDEEPARLLNRYIVDEE